MGDRWVLHTPRIFDRSHDLRASRFTGPAHDPWTDVPDRGREGRARVQSVFPRILPGQRAQFISVGDIDPAIEIARGQLPKPFVIPDRLQCVAKDQVEESLSGSRTY